MGEASEGELILNNFGAVNFPMSIWYSAQKSLIVVAYAGAFTMPRITSVIDASISLSIVMFFCLLIGHLLFGSTIPKSPSKVQHLKQMPVACTPHFAHLTLKY